MHGGLECYAQLMHAMGGANGKCLQVQLEGWVNAVNVLRVQAGNLEFSYSGK